MKALDRRRPFALVLVVLLLAGCVQSTPTRSVATATPTLGPTPAADDPVRAALAALPAATAIGVAADWNGLSQSSPIESHYRLTRQGDRFSGRSRAIVNRYRDLPLVTTNTIDLPVAEVQEALALLADTPLQVGPYRPTTEQFDDYPSIVIAFDTPAGRLAFYSRSNTGSMMPWGLSFGGRTYVVTDDTPWQAKRSLPGTGRPSGFVPSSAQGTATPTVSGRRGSLFCQRPMIPSDPLVVPPVPLGAQTYTPAAGGNLSQIVTIGFTGLGDNTRHEWRDPQQIAAFVALFDRPLPRALDDQQLAWSSYDTIDIRFQMTGNDFIIAKYDPYLDVMRWQKLRADQRPDDRDVRTAGVARARVGRGLRHRKRAPVTPSPAHHRLTPRRQRPTMGRAISRSLQ